ncbi:MAG: AI-2E family transporter, partial [bacterium]|nr:AI-2E family transporter [bacterium]
MTRKIEFTTRTLVVTTGFLFLLWFLFQVRDIILLLFTSIIFMSALDPLVERLASWKVPRAIAIFLCYIVVIGLVVALVSFIFVPIVEETGRLIRVFPDYVPALLRQINIDPAVVDRTILEKQAETLAQNIGNIVNVGRSILNGFLGVMTLAVFTFYLLLERGNLERYLAMIIAPRQQETILRVITLMESRLGAWVRGELTLMTIIGLFSYIGLRL